MDWMACNRKRVKVKDVATIKRGVEIGSSEVSIDREGTYEYLVLNMDKVDKLGCFLATESDCIRTATPVSAKYLTARDDVVVGIGHNTGTFVVGEMEEDCIIPTDCIVFRPDKTRMLPEYLCGKIETYKAGIESHFHTGKSEEEFWQNFMKGDEGISEADTYESYAESTIELPDMAEQQREGESVRATMDLRAAEYERHFERLRNEQKAQTLYQLLGEYYELTVEDASEEEVVYLGEDQILVRVRYRENATRIRKVLSEWYKEFCNKNAEEVLGEVYPKVADFIVRKPTMEINDNANLLIDYLPNHNKICIHPLLFTAPKEYIRYVILEVMVHICYRRGTVKYEEVMERIMPDWISYLVTLFDMINYDACIPSYAE